MSIEREIKPCKACQDRGKNWNGSDPRCAFSDGVFNTDNWNCATMNALRDICGKNYLCSEDQYASIIYSGIDCHFIVLTWYKHRGRTEGAYILSDHECRPITLEEAETAIAANPALIGKEG